MTPTNPQQHKGSNPTIKVLIKGTDTLYGCSKKCFEPERPRGEWFIAASLCAADPLHKAAIGFSLLGAFNSNV